MRTVLPSVDLITETDIVIPYGTITNIKYLCEVQFPKDTSINKEILR